MLTVLDSLQAVAVNASTIAMLTPAAPAPEPVPSPTPDEMTAATITPGLPGFLVFFLLAVAVVLLGWDMTRRIRRSGARDAVARRHAQAEAAQEGEGTEAAQADEAPEASQEDAEPQAAQEGEPGREDDARD